MLICIGMKEVNRLLQFIWLFGILILSGQSGPINEVFLLIHSLTDYLQQICVKGLPSVMWYLLDVVVVSIGVELLERGWLLVRITSLFDTMWFSFLIDLRINSILEFINPSKRVSRTVLWRLDPIFIQYSHGRRVQRTLVGLGDSPKQSSGADPCAAPPVNLWPVSYTHLTLPTNREG